MRGVLLLMLAASLAGCSRPNDLLTRRPLFDPQDSADAPRFRSGVWRLIWPNFADNPCAFDSAQPIPAWPGCNAAEIVVPGQMTAIAFMPSLLGSALIARRRPYVLAAGPELVLQRYSEVETGRYSYDVMDRVSLDAAGQIVAARLTPITCFDPSTYAAAVEWQANTLTDDNTHPIEDEPAPSAKLDLAPGFIRDARGDCVPRNLAALEAAAAATAAASTEGVNFRWVRDGTR